MRLLTCDIERAGRDAGPYYVWWRRASVPAIFRCMKAHWYYAFGAQTCIVGATPQSKQSTHALVGQASRLSRPDRRDACPTKGILSSPKIAALTIAVEARP